MKYEYGAYMEWNGQGKQRYQEKKALIEPKKCKQTPSFYNVAVTLFLSCTDTVSHQDGKRQHADNIFLPLGLEIF